MDTWVVAAAAGAGYVAQHCKNLVKGRQSFSDSSCESPNSRPESSLIAQKIKDKKSCPCGAVHSKRVDEEICSERERLSRDASAEIASTSWSACQNSVALGDCANCGAFSTVDLVPEFLGYEDVQGTRKGVRVHGDMDEIDGNLSMQPSTREGVSYGFARKKSSLRSRRTNEQLIKPLSSLESCLMAQLYKEQAEMEEYTFSSFSSPCTLTVRPFLVTGGSRIISRATGDSFSLPIGAVQNKMHAATNSQDTTTVFGVPQLHSVGSIKYQRKANTKMQCRRLSDSGGVNGKHQRLQGSSHGALLFCLGISIGLMSSFLTNKREVDKLSNLLKQTESLVQDLQDELEMKDSLTVKELAVEDYDSQDTQNDVFNSRTLRAFFPEEKLDNYHNGYNEQKAEEDSFSKIEAELEAELERLELSMNSCRLDRKISNLVEIDVDYMPDVVEGELTADFLPRQSGPQHDADRDGSGGSTTHSVHSAISPRELTLRLHEVIQSRLEERVQELEIALQNSQRKIRYMGSQHKSYLREFSNSESGCSSNQGSPVVKEQNHADQPVVINLSGEALDAYTEAYDEFTKINELEEEDTPPGVKGVHKQGRLHTSDQNISWLHNDEVNNEMQGKSLTDDRLLMSDTQQEGGDDYYLSNGIFTRGDENDDGYDEMEELLIKNIVEQARKGSPVVLNAQRALCSPDENGHSL